jgi:hypothetical protein
MNDSSFPSDEIDPGSARLYGIVARASRRRSEQYGFRTDISTGLALR